MLLSLQKWFNFDKLTPLLFLIKTMIILKQFYLFSLLIFILNISAQNPLKNFCDSRKLNKKTVFVCLNPSECRACVIPLDEFFKKIREINKTIDVFIVTRDSISASEQNLFLTALGINKKEDKNTFIVSNKSLHEFLRKKEDDAMVGLVINGKLISHFNLINENLKKFFDSISPEFSIAVSEKIKLNNNLFSPANSLASVVIINHQIYLHTWNFSCITKYDTHGTAVKYVFFDSLQLDYFELSKRILSPVQYQKNIEHFNKKKSKTYKKSDISLISIIKFQENSLALCCNLRFYNDSTYKNQPASYADEQGFLVILDSNLNNVKRIITFDCDGISFYEQGRSSNKYMYFARYDKEKNKKYLSEFELQDDKLKKKRDFLLPYSDTPIIETICPFVTDSNFVAVAYPLGEKSPEKFELYEINLTNGSTNRVIKLKGMYVYGPLIQITPKKNYILYAGKPKQMSVIGYDRKSNKLIKCQETTESSLQVNSRWFPYFIGDTLLKVTYKE